MQGFYVDLCSYARDLQQRFNFRGERESPSLLDVVKGLDTKMVAGEKQHRLPGAQVADPKGEHSVQVLDTIRPFLLIEMNNDLRVGVRYEPVPFVLQLVA